MYLGKSFTGLCYVLFQEIVILSLGILVIDAKKDCGGTLTTPNGSIKSPNYPDLYPNSVNCTWLIKVTPGNVISLRTTAFDVEESYNCESDAVYIYDGENSHAKIIDKPFCGNRAPAAITSSHNTLFIVFISDFGVRKNGFQLDYQLVPTCRQTIRQDSGIISSPRYPKDYYPNANCSYLIVAGEHKQIELQFRDFEIEPHPPAAVVCYDHVSVYDVLPKGLSLLKTMCGSILPSTIHSATNKLLVLFVSDSSVVKKGFLAKFSASYRKCKDNEFSCRNGLCTNSSLVCNKHDDCGDMSDEMSCHCQKNEWMCDDGRCIPANLTCNGVVDCALGGDEKNCTSRNVTSACGSAMPKCERICTYTGVSSSCRCTEGYTLNPKTSKCEDVNECLHENGGCQERCINFPGGYRCGCFNSGFAVKNGKCVDLDECAANAHQCHQACINTVGSYACQCFRGYVTAYNDPRRCKDIDECLEGVPGCFGQCINTLGSYHCNCESGFKAINDRTRCRDIDECSTGTSGCAQLCRNSVGSYTCSCRTGFRKVANNPHSCEDIDECRAQRSCEHGCINTYGSFRCTCKHGFKLINQTRCEDIDECAKRTDNSCHGTCTNVPGSYRCSCPAGYLLQNDGRCIEQDSYQICGKAAVPRIPRKWENASEETWGWQTFFTVTLGTFEILLDECMGIIVDEKFILAAAHCLNLRDWVIPASNLTVYVRQTNLGRGGTVGYKVQNVMMPTTGNGQPQEIALIKLAKAMKFDKNVHAICLPDVWPDDQLRVGRAGTLLAWGRFAAEQTAQKNFGITYPGRIDREFPVSSTFQKIIDRSLRKVLMRVVQEGLFKRTQAITRLQYRGVTIRSSSNCQWFLPKSVMPSSVLCTEYKGEAKTKDDQDPNRGQDPNRRMSIASSSFPVNFTTNEKCMEQRNQWERLRMEKHQSFEEATVARQHCIPASGAPLMTKSLVRYGDVTVNSWILSGILVYGGAHPTRQGCRRRYRYNIIHRIDYILPWIKSTIQVAHDSQPSFVAR